MAAFHDLDVVRIARLLEPDRDYGGSERVRRPPRVGDTGTIVHVYDFAQGEAFYMVESVDEEGYTVWLADFSASELERVWNAPGGNG